jgi:hypothetical protein
MGCEIFVADKMSAEAKLHVGGNLDASLIYLKSTFFFIMNSTICIWFDVYLSLDGCIDTGPIVLYYSLHPKM